MVALAEIGSSSSEFHPVTVEDVKRMDLLLEVVNIYSIARSLANWGGIRQKVRFTPNGFELQIEVPSTGILPKGIKFIFENQNEHPAYIELQRLDRNHGIRFEEPFWIHQLRLCTAPLNGKTYNSLLFINTRTGSALMLKDDCSLEFIGNPESYLSGHPA